MFSYEIMGKKFTIIQLSPASQLMENQHEESQCIPTPLAWNVFQLPEWMHKLSVAGTYFIEIGLVFLFFAPTSQMRKLSCLLQVKPIKYFNFLKKCLQMSVLNSY